MSSPIINQLLQTKQEGYSRLHQDPHSPLQPSISLQPNTFQAERTQNEQDFKIRNSKSLLGRVGQFLEQRRQLEEKNRPGGTCEHLLPNIILASIENSEKEEILQPEEIDPYTEKNLVSDQLLIRKDSSHPLDTLTERDSEEQEIDEIEKANKDSPQKRSKSPFKNRNKRPFPRLVKRKNKPKRQLKPFFERLKDDEHVREEKMKRLQQEEEEKKQKEIEQCSFKPTINENKKKEHSQTLHQKELFEDESTIPTQMNLQQLHLPSGFNGIPFGFTNPSSMILNSSTQNTQSVTQPNSILGHSQMSTTDTATVRQNVPPEERLLNWGKKRDQRNEELKRLFEEKEMAEATFTPETTPLPHPTTPRSISHGSTRTTPIKNSSMDEKFQKQQLSARLTARSSFKDASEKNGEDGAISAQSQKEKETNEEEFSENEEISENHREETQNKTKKAQGKPSSVDAYLQLNPFFRLTHISRPRDAQTLLQMEEEEEMNKSKESDDKANSTKEKSFPDENELKIKRLLNQEVNSSLTTSVSFPTPSKSPNITMQTPSWQHPFVPPLHLSPQQGSSLTSPSSRSLQAQHQSSLSNTPFTNTGSVPQRRPNNQNVFQQSQPPQTPMSSSRSISSATSMKTPVQLISSQFPPLSSGLPQIPLLSSNLFTLSLSSNTPFTSAASVSPSHMSTPIHPPQSNQFSTLLTPQTDRPLFSFDASSAPQNDFSQSIPQSTTPTYQQTNASACSSRSMRPQSARRSTRTTPEQTNSQRRGQMSYRSSAMTTRTASSALTTPKISVPKNAANAQNEQKNGPPASPGCRRPHTAFTSPSTYSPSFVAFLERQEKAMRQLQKRKYGEELANIKEKEKMKKKRKEERRKERAEWREERERRLKLFQKHEEKERRKQEKMEQLKKRQEERDSTHLDPEQQTSGEEKEKEKEDEYGSNEYETDDESEEELLSLLTATPDSLQSLSEESSLSSTILNEYDNEDDSDSRMWRSQRSVSTRRMSNSQKRGVDALSQGDEERKWRERKMAAERVAEAESSKTPFRPSIDEAAKRTEGKLSRFFKKVNEAKSEQSQFEEDADYENITSEGQNGTNRRLSIPSVHKASPASSEVIVGVKEDYLEWVKKEDEKKQKVREAVIKEREKNELSQCTFHPRINKGTRRTTVLVQARLADI
ncbi:uncharacterized protein MONOS_8799 [Monocercomonoides exilis]|uniref:uncharacterized protein n=1 Tax=Monocercomonoides exilis TaxID=2049356 RepID=UPI00355A3853|nr:hypothetical protein MONOS_8799 [Monocercomonoides exilis]|eukprot:MONOS_8799.1-p1 / transcript=MONOS_8799.1 / gene=MONOS_8799 / organism=Monocercomonoides_exilis_PA203 / gene_product=unspecified product / transcript_product=unspecified product / location=Mono_scaffold00342:28521-32015(+) / protein_length=1165 / sequence_SO=supercontig / SO=protein_coding / is_pseudo=false